MQYVLYIQLTVMILGLIKDLRNSESTEIDPVKLVELLSRIGKAVGVKELNSETLTAISPDIIALVKILRELKDPE